MLVISETTAGAMGRAQDASYCRELHDWLLQRPELAVRADLITPAWCHQALSFTRSYGIEGEEPIAWFARALLLRGADWFDAEPARQILTDQNDEETKVYQLNCLLEGIGDG